MRGSHHKGFSLISVVFLVMIVTLGGMLLIQFLSKSANSVSRIQSQDDLLTLRKVIREGLDCAAMATEFSTDCVGTYFALKAAGKRIIGEPSQEAWKLGSWHVRGTCLPLGAGRGVQVQIAKLNEDGSFASHPDTKSVYEWSPLFSADVLFCAH